jgi:outer membrane protein assembly factor BamD (BamD/ComL family)
MRLVAGSIVAAVLIAGCSVPPAEELFATARESQKRAEAGLGSPPQIQDSLFLSAINAYEAVVEEYPEHPLSEVSLFTIAELHQNGTRRFSDAIGAFRRYAGIYPGTPKTAVSMFMIGFLFNNEIHNIDSAAAAYRAFLAAFPDHELASSARAELDNLGKSPEEIIARQLAAAKNDAEKGETKTSRGGK